MQIKIDLMFILFGIGISSGVIALDTSANKQAQVSVSLNQTNLFELDNATHSSHEGSLDICVSWPTTVGLWSAHIESSTTPDQAGVSAYIEQSNGDSGSALDQNDKGRAQLSELFLSGTANSNSYHIGLFDVGGLFDNSNIANDENSQFMSTELINNPSIPFPDYALGAFYELSQSSDRAIAVRMAMASAKGLADNPSRSYSDLIDVSSQENGIFAISEIELNLSIVPRFGLWYRSSTIESNNEVVDESLGVYSSIDGTLSHWGWNIRGGGDFEGDTKLRFLSTALERNFKVSVFGVGASTSQSLAFEDVNEYQLETYYKYKVQNFESTLLFQYRENDSGESTTVLGLRLNYVY